MKTMKKIVAILAVALMLCSILPLSAFAAAGDEYELVTDIADLQIGDQIIIFAVNDNTVLSTTQNGNNRGKTDATPNGTIITATDAMQIITVEAGLTEGTYAFNVGNGYLYAASSSKNYLRTETALSANSSWSIEIAADGVATIKATGTNTRNWMRYNKSSSIFACYGSGQNDIAIYKLSAGEQCDHSALSCGATCSVCGETVDHEYDSNCDADCNNCGSKRDVPGHEYSGALDTSCNNCGGIREVVLPTDPTEIVDAAYGLAQGEAFPSAVQLTGVIASVDTVYSEQYSNVTVTIDVIDANGNLIEGKAIQCYRLKGTGADVIAAGDTITVSGILKNYNGKIEFDTGCTLVSYEQTGCAHEYLYECATTCKLCGKGERDVVCVSDTYACQDGLCIYCGNDVLAVEHAFDDQWDADCNYGCGYTREVEEKPEMNEAALDFSTTDQRTEYSTEIQVWANGDLILTNNKAGSTSNVGDYVKPARFYKSSEIIIAYPGLTKLVIDANGIDSKYAWESTLDAANLTYTVDNGVYTINFAAPVDSITLSCAIQVRANSITATAIKAAGACEHTYDNACDVDCNKCGAVRVIEHAYVESIVDSTCTTTGTTTYKCSVCGDSYTEEIPVKPHTYVDGKCSACGAELPSEATITFGEDKAQRIEFSTESQKWENNGLVLINNKGTGNAIADYTNPVRMYKGSEIIISFPGMTSLVIDATGSDSDKLWDATLTAAGLKFTVEEKIYTITFAEPTDSITLTAANQVRALTITASSVATGCAHEYDNACDVDCNLCYEAREVQHSVKHVAAAAATCAANGNIEYWYCDVCGMAWLNAECTLNTNLRAVVLPATGEHTYDDEYDADCNVCGDIREVPDKPVSTVYGDANGDGNVTILDVIMLQQFIAGYEVTLNGEAADANGDGNVTILDVIMLQQFIAGYEVTLGPQTTYNDGELSEWGNN